MKPCARCDWQPSEGDTLLDHAAEHPLCGVCSKSLTAYERTVCEHCYTRAQEDLAGIAAMYAELPHHLGHLRSPNYDRGRPDAIDGRPLPGGDVLALLGRGSEGLAEDGLTTRKKDPVSVSFELGWWALAWQDQRGEHVFVGTAARAIRYLTAHGRWAATSHDGFAEYATDLRSLHARLEGATSRRRSPVRAGADCFRCQGTLVRLIDADGLEQDRVTCQKCGHRLSQAEYASTLKVAAAAAAWVTVEGSVYGTVAVLAHETGRPHRTLRSWHQRQQIRSLTFGGILFLHAADVQARDTERRTAMTTDPRTSPGGISAASVWAANNLTPMSASMKPCPPCDDGHQHEYDDDAPFDADDIRAYFRSIGNASSFGDPCVWCDHQKCGVCPPPRPV